MNYYIHGDAANADQIRVAFEKLGYDTSRHLFNAKSVLYFTLDGEIRATTCNCTPAIIKTHPDYKELELPIQAKFRVGDWYLCTKDFLGKGVRFDKGKTYHCGKDDCLQQFDKGAHVAIVPQLYNHFKLWTIADAQDGDVLALNGKPFIYSHGYGKNYCYIDACGQFRVSFNLVFEGNCVLPATKEQRDLLFAKMREAGYEWDAGKKELRKIQPHYDIANFQPFDKVLIRVGNKSKWTCDFFSYYHKGFHCIGTDDWSQCIPFNDDTKHLLGTTDMCPKEYINW